MGPEASRPSGVLLIQWPPVTLNSVLRENPCLPCIERITRSDGELLDGHIHRPDQDTWKISASPTPGNSPADWEQSNKGRWVVPVGGGIGRIMRLGFQPVNLTLQFYGNAVLPELCPGIAFLFPKKPKK
jgi:hypothetical protein